MKKIAPIVMVAFLAAAFTSCKKDYVCTCKILGQETKSDIKDAKKKDAQEACDKLDATAKILDGSCSLN